MFSNIRFNIVLEIKGKILQLYYRSNSRDGRALVANAGDQGSLPFLGNFPKKNFITEEIQILL